jgi:hypothetical protein
VTAALLTKGLQHHHIFLFVPHGNLKINTDSENDAQKLQSLRELKKFHKANQLLISFMDKAANISIIWHSTE